MSPDDRAARRRQLAQLRKQAATCRNCDLWKRGTQTVFGAGDVGAPVMVVGEQPGDQEDKAGEPFVGPAGSLLRAVLEEAGLDPDSVYFTHPSSILRAPDSASRAAARRQFLDDWKQIVKALKRSRRT